MIQFPDYIKIYVDDENIKKGKKEILINKLTGLLPGLVKPGL
jgi:hypothetical protein